MDIGAFEVKFYSIRCVELRFNEMVSFVYCIAAARATEHQGTHETLLDGMEFIFSVQVGRSRLGQPQLCEQARRYITLAQQFVP